MSGAGHCLGDFIVIMPKGNQEVRYVLIEVYLKVILFKMYRTQRPFFQCSSPVFSSLHLCLGTTCYMGEGREERVGKEQEMKEKRNGRLSGKIAYMNYNDSLYNVLGFFLIISL